MSCKVNFKKIKYLGEDVNIIDHIVASNGKRSQLYDDIREYLDNKYKDTPEFDITGRKAYREYLKIYTPSFAIMYDYRNGESSVISTDSNGEPLLEDFIQELSSEYTSTPYIDQLAKLNFVYEKSVNSENAVINFNSFLHNINVDGSIKRYTYDGAKSIIYNGKIYELFSGYYDSLVIEYDRNNNIKRIFKDFYQFESYMINSKEQATDSMFSFLFIPANIKINSTEDNQESNTNKLFSVDVENSILNRLIIENQSDSSVKIDSVNDVYTIDTKSFLNIISNNIKETNPDISSVYNELSKYVSDFSKTVLVPSVYHDFDNNLNKLSTKRSITEGINIKYKSSVNDEIIISSRLHNRNQLLTYIHELIHSVTLDTMYSLNSETKTLKENYRRQIKELYDYAKEQSPDIVSMYGMGNIDEFMAEAFSDVDFANKLSSIPAKNPNLFVNLYEELISAVKSMLYVFLPNSFRHNPTLLDEVLTVTLNMINDLSNKSSQLRSIPNYNYFNIDDSSFTFKESQKLYTKIVDKSLKNTEGKFDEEHNISHQLIKYLRGQSAFPIDKIDRYINTAARNIKNKEGKKTRKKINNRISDKIKRYKKGGKFYDSSVNDKVLHALEEINEYIESNGSKKELADVVAQLKVLKKAKVKDDYKRLSNNESPLSFMSSISSDQIISASKDYTNQIKEGVSELFKSNPELADVGTQEQYSQYLDTVFPDSKVKDILHHGVVKRRGKSEDFIEFSDINMSSGTYGKGYYFSPVYNKFYDNAEFNKYVIVNSKRIISKSEHTKLFEEYKKRGYLGTIGLADTTSMFKEVRDKYDTIDARDRELIVFNPKQIHILGSEKDIQKFKGFVDRNTSSIDDTYYQLESDLNSQPIPELDNYLIKFLKDNFHVKTKEFDSLKERLGVNALGATDVMNKLIWYVKNRNEETVPEEVGHMIVMLMGVNHPDIEELKANIKGWSEYQDVYDQYIDLYKDEEKVVIEAMGKLLAKSMVKNYKLAGVNKSLLKRILDAITKILNNPTISDAIVFHKHLADKIAINVLSGNKDYIREITNLNPNLDYDFEVKSNPFAKNIIDTFTHKNSMLTGSLAIALYGENIRRERGKGIHDLDFVVKDIDHYNNVIVPNIEKLGGIPGHFGWTKDDSITYSFLIPKKGYKIKVLSRKGGISNGYIRAYELYDSEGNQVEPTQDNVMSVDFFVKTSEDSIDFKYSDTMRPASLIYGGKLSLGNKSPYFFDRDKDQEDYVLRNPKSFIPFENAIYYQLDTQPKQAILSPSEPRKLSSVLSDVISDNNASEQLKSLAKLLNETISNTNADVEVRSTTNDILLSKRDPNIETNSNIHRMNGLAIPTTEDSPAHILINNDLDTADAINTILHEGIHMATMAELASNSSKATKWKNFYKKAKQNIIDAGYDSDMHALSNADEFLTAVFTDSQFREILSNTKPVRGSNEILNLLNEVAHLIKNIIGFKGSDVSLLEDSLLMSTELLEGISADKNNIDPSALMYPELTPMSSVSSSNKTFNASFNSKQNKIKEKIDSVKEIERGRVFISSEDLLKKLGGRAGKNIKLLSKVKDGMTRYIIWDEKEQKEVIVQNRPSDFGQLLFARSKDYNKDLVNKGNNDADNIRRRGMGTTLHYVVEKIIEELDNQNSSLELLKPDFGNMGSWEDFYNKNKDKYLKSILTAGKDSEIFNIIYSSRRGGAYRHTIDQDDIIDPTGDAIQLSEEERSFYVDEKDVEQLMRLAFKTYFSIYETQAKMSWDKEGEIGRPMIIPEAPVYSKKKDLKGTIDLLVVYDNGKVGHFDWKFMGLVKEMTKQKFIPQEELEKQKITGYNPDRWGYTYIKRSVMDKLFVKKDTFDKQVSSYKDILNTEFGINKGDIVQSRVIPVNMVFAKKSTGEKYTFTNDKGKLIVADKKVETNRLQFIDHDYELLQSITLAKELTGDKEMDKFLTKLYQERDRVKANLRLQKGNENLKTSLKDIEDTIYSIVVKQDIGTVAERIYNIANTISNNLNNPKYIDVEDNNRTVSVLNDNYINDSDLNYFEDILILYSDLMKSSENRIKQLESLAKREVDDAKKLKYNQEADELRNLLSNQYRITTNVLAEISAERDRRFIEITEEGRYMGSAGTYGITVDKNTMINSGIGLTDRVGKYSDASGISRYFTALSEFNHPHLRLYKDLLDNLNYSVKQYVDDTSDKISKATEGLKAWAKQNSKSMSEVYDLFIKYNAENNDYSLINPYADELITDIKNARENKDIEWLKKHLEFNESAFLDALNRYKKSIAIIYTNKSDIDEKIQEFYTAYHPESGNYSYLNAKNKFMVVNDYAKNKYKSEKYNYIMKQKELRDFYMMYRDVMSGISSNLQNSGIVVDEFFIPNVRKDFIDTISQNGLLNVENISGIKELISKANQVRENDVDFGFSSSSESDVNIIPLQFKDRIPGDISLKSKDLTKSLLLFAYSSKLHQLSKDIEGISVGLRKSLATTKLMKKDVYGNLINNEEVSADENTRIYQVLDSYIRKYIYGENLQELGEVLGSKERTKWLLDLMSYQSKVSLAFNHLSLLGGHINAETQILAEAVKGKHFDKKQWASSEKEVISNSKESALAYEFFEVSAEGNSGLVYEKANKLSISKLRSKYNKSLAYAGQRKSDDILDKVYVTAMMKNYILHPDGKTIFPKQEAKVFLKGTEYEGREDEMKTMWESMQVSENAEEGAEGILKIMRGDGKEEITKEQFIKFRNRVRSLASKAKGNYNSEDSYLYGTNLGLRALMQYRGWMPAFIKERYGAATYNPVTDDVEVGRYRAFLGNMIGEGLIPSLKKAHKILAMYLGDLVTFNKFNLVQPSEDYVRNTFNRWANNNPGQYEELIRKYKNYENAEEMAMEEWKQSMQAAIKKSFVEIRSYLLLIGAGLSIGFAIGDDELEERPFVREFVKVINRAQMEVGFFFIPSEMTKLVTRSPMAVFGLLSEVTKLAENSIEETVDFIAGADDNKTVDIFSISDSGMSIDFFKESSDRTPRFNYTLRAIPGVRGVSRFLEFFESKDDDKVTIYEYLFGDSNTVYKR